MRATTAEATCWLRCGRLVRRSVRAQLRRMAIDFDVDLQIDEEKTLLDTTLFLTVRGDSADAFVAGVRGAVDKASRRT